MLRRRVSTLATGTLLVTGSLAGTLAGTGPAQAADGTLFHPYTIQPRTVGRERGDG